MKSTREAIRNGVLRALELLVSKQVRDANKPRMRLLVGRDGKPIFHTVRDRLGDIMRVYRAYPLPNRHRPKYDGADLRAIRAEKGVGRPKGLPLKTTRCPWPHPVANTHSIALQVHGSHRAAAKALGLNLSTFQRRLAKERSAV